MRRSWGLAAAACGLALAASACGVQSTGVHVASTLPFSASVLTNPPTASSAGDNAEVTLVLVSPSGTFHQVRRWVGKKPAKPVDLLQYLATTSPDDDASSLLTAVPPDLELKPTDHAHEFYIASPAKIGSVALKQMACTLDGYWREQPDDGRDKSTQFILPNGVQNGWDDCQQIFPPEPAPTTTSVRTKPGAPTGTPTGR